MGKFYILYIYYEFGGLGFYIIYISFHLQEFVRNNKSQLNTLFSISLWNFGHQPFSIVIIVVTIHNCSAEMKSMPLYNYWPN